MRVRANVRDAGLIFPPSTIQNGADLLVDSITNHESKGDNLERPNIVRQGIRSVSGRDHEIDTGQCLGRLLHSPGNGLVGARDI